MPPYDPSKDPDLVDPKKPSAPPTTEQVRKKAYKQIDRQTQKTQDKVGKQIATQAGQANQEPSRFSPLSILSVVPAAVAAATTPDEYLVGRVGSGEAPKRVGDMSLVEQIFGDQQLSLADPLKALVFGDRPDLMKNYIAGNADSGTNRAITVLEAAGLTGDMLLDPLNLVGGTGVADDAFKVLEQGGRLTKTAEFLAERAAVKGADSLPAKALKVIEDYHSVLDGIDAQVAAGAVDEATAATARAEAGAGARAAYEPLLGKDIISNGTDLGKARFLPDSVVTEGGFGARARTALMTERTTELSKAAAAALGETNALAVGSKLRFPIFGGKTADEAVKEVWARGYGALTQEGREAMGITGRIHRATLEDFTSGRALNPFSSKAAGVMKYDDAASQFVTRFSPLGFIREHSIKGGETLVDRGASMLRPVAIGRAGKIWKAGLELAEGSSAAVDSGMARLRKLLGPEAVASFEAKAAKQGSEAVFANYPLTVLNEARLDGLIRSGGKRLATAAARTEQEITTTLLQDAEVDVAKWTLRGTDEVVTPTWDRLKQAAFESVDSPIEGGGTLKTDLAQALHDSMRRLDIPFNLDEISSKSISDSVRQVFGRVVNDPEFSTAIEEITKKYGPRMAEKDVSKGDLLRATMNALTTATTIAKETHGVFDWVEAMTKVRSAKDLFSSRGAEELGKEAKLLSYMEDMGLAVLYRAQEGELSTPEIHQLITDMADQAGGAMTRLTDTFDRLIQAKDELNRGLKLRGVTEEQIAKIEDDIAQNVMDRDGMAKALADATEEARVARGDLAVTDEELRAQRSALREVERAAQKLEETHLALLDYRSLQDELASRLDDLQTAAEALDLAAVDTQPLLERISQLTTRDFLDADFPAGGFPRKGVSRADSPRPSFLINQALGDGVKATNAGVQQQLFNRSLSLARDLFGDSIDLAEIAAHSSFTKTLTKEFNMTEGALNARSIARFFEEQADPRLTKLADDAGGWEFLLRGNAPDVVEDIKRVGDLVKAQRETKIARLLQLQAAGEAVVVPPAFTRLGTTHRAMAEFMMGTFTDRLEAITPLVDDFVDALSNGQTDRLQEIIASGDGPMGLLRQMQDGDFSYLNSLVTELSRGLDIAVGSVGGFGNYDSFKMLREIIMSDPAKLAVFERAQSVFEGIQNAAVIANATAEAAEHHAYMVEEIDSIVGIMPNGPLLQNRKDDLLEALLPADMPAMQEAVDLTAEQRAQISDVLKEASKRVRSSRSKLETLGRQSERWRVHLDEKLKDLNLIDGWIDNYQTFIDDANDQALRRALDLQRSVELMDGTPVVAKILSASADVSTVKKGFIDFAQDPRVSFKTLADGSTVRRTDDEIMKLWNRRVEGAAKWLETLKDRAVNGYTTASGREVLPIDRYGYSKAIEQEWMLSKAEEGFSGVWKHAALADQGGAWAMIALATGGRSKEVNGFGAALDMVVGMLKAGYVGTPAFSNRNLMGATMENIRQGVDPRVSFRVFGADSTVGAIEGMISYANTVQDEVLAGELRDVISEAQKAAREHFGDDVFDSVVEARQIGVTDSVFQFQDISGIGAGAEGTMTGLQMIRSWGKAIKDTTKVARLENEAQRGDGGILGILASATGGAGAISTHPARWYEQFMAARIEALSRRKIWEKALAGRPDLISRVNELEELALPFTRRPGVESLVRVDLYAQRRIGGDTAETAFLRMMSSHFDYTDLSEADETLKRWMPFWIWRSRSVNHYAEMALAKPSTLGHTFALWDKEHSSRDPRAPRYTQEAGGGFNAKMQLGLAIPDPASDLINLANQAGRGAQDYGLLAPVGAVVEPLKQMAAADTNALLGAVFSITSGVTPEGVPIDTPASIQGPLNAIASAPGGSDFVEAFAYRGKGDKWYWKWPGAANALGETLPVLNQITKITQPIEDGDGIRQDAFGVVARFFGSPVRAVPLAEQERTRKATMIRRRIEAQEAKRRNG